MAKTVLGIARFSNFELFEDEAIARDWLERAGSTPREPAPGPGRPLKRFAVPALLLVVTGLALRMRRRRP
jgi:hypothetical protein